MAIKRLFVALGMLASVTACSNPSRPEAGASSATRTVAPPPIEASGEISPQVAASVAGPEPVVGIPDAREPDTPVASASAKHTVAPPAIKLPQPAPDAKVVKPPKPIKANPPPAILSNAIRPEPEALLIVVADAEVQARTAAADAGASRIQGQLELIAGRGQSLDADEMSQAVVYFIPDTPIAAAKPGQFQIYTHNKEFEPASMVIPLGSTISFPNQDEILHNVFSVSPQSSFDLGIYGEGKSADYRFKKTGLALINCNVHQSMQANVLVVDTPYIVSPDKQGRFKLANLPAGGGKLAVWHPRANVQEQIVRMPLAKPVSLRLDLTKPRITDHLNKERKAYR